MSFVVGMMVVVRENVESTMLNFWDVISSFLNVVLDVKELKCD